MRFLEAVAVVTMRQLRLTLRDTAVTRGRWVQVRLGRHLPSLCSHSLNVGCAYRSHEREIAGSRPARCLPAEYTGSHSSRAVACRCAPRVASKKQLHLETTFP